MKKIKLKVIDSIGLHVDSALVAARTAERYESNVFIEFGNRKVDMKSLLSIISLEVTSNSEIKIGIDGQDEDDACKDIINALQSSNIAIVC